MSTEKVPAPGVKYGKWALIEPVPDAKPKRWLCQCDCGTKRSVLQASMTSGRSRHCGCDTPGLQIRRK